MKMQNMLHEKDVVKKLKEDVDKIKDQLDLIVKAIVKNNSDDAKEDK